LPQAHHLAVHDVGEHGPELVAFATLNLVEPDVTGSALHTCPIPLGEKRLLRAPRLAPAHAVPHVGID
jgi:hypothetical protein